MKSILEKLKVLKHIEELTKGASQKSGSPNEKDLLNSYLVNSFHLVNQKTFMGHSLCMRQNLNFIMNFDKTLSGKSNNT